MKYRNDSREVTRVERERAVVRGTQPEGSGDEQDAARRVRDMFSRIAPRYDFLNHFLSASFDTLWRAKTARHFAGILSRPDARVLDLCCGTGDLAFALAKRAVRLAGSTGGRFFGADFSLPMLELASQKNSTQLGSVTFFAADALALPFEDSSFDLVATAFGFRNLANYERGLCEILRVLRPGGRLGILEFCEPRSGVLAALFRYYFTRVLPRIGGAISGSGEAYSYLPTSVQKFPNPETLKSWIEDAGFKDVSYERWTFGAVALYGATR
ncbi:MAG TPA: bifunctional demethylmenaquinone methyltransferase/2-methoxy-6-polyprenyl-1,4-benzoquinol methylase UbiE [Verrucomicrobiae bacterium]|nr:bifunctional demethylmenaquinone methyltransferase/2-methoxy-6-polyprenyl-1,4-benzoquinol methylase UbiE [Verrucomicrobiae bacterium]